MVRNFAKTPRSVLAWSTQIHNKILPSLIDWCKKVRENGTTKTASSEKKESLAQVKEDISI